MHQLGAMSQRYDERMQMIMDQDDFDPYQVELLNRLFDPVEFFKQQNSKINEKIRPRPR